MRQETVAARVPIVAVFGSGRPEHANGELAYQVGALAADCRMHLLTGGGQGVMADACRGFREHAATGLCSLGILPCGVTPDLPRPGYPNRWVDIPIQTHLRGEDPESTTSRNPINVLTASRAIFLYGNAGTKAEAGLCTRFGKTALAVLDCARQSEEQEFSEAMRTLGISCVFVEGDRDGVFSLRQVRKFLRFDRQT